MDQNDFPQCMHAMAAAFHRHRIDPAACTITMPHRQWWDLYTVLDRKFRGFMPYDGRPPAPDRFKYMGFTFVAVDEQNVEETKP